MNKQDVIDFFDRCAPGWDAGLIRNDAVTREILDNAGIGEGMSVLDVACGTGVLFPFYLRRGVASVTGVDISGGMVRIAREKFAGESRITVLCADAETIRPDRQFDRIMVYNALPHFQDPGRLVRNLAAALKDGGRLTIAHGESRERIDAHHRGSARHVSNGLMPIEELKALCDPYLEVDVMISDERMVQLCGTKR